MPQFFIKHPIVAIVIAILTIIVGLVVMGTLPVAQFPEIAPPEIKISATYVGADAETVEQSVATPVEQEMSGVDNMLYMYSFNANNGQADMRVAFDIKTDPDIDQVLAQIRQSQAQPQLPTDVKNYGITVEKSLSSPLMLFNLYSPKGTYDATFLANYAYININDAMTRVPGISRVQVFGAGQYAMRFWVKPDRLAKLGITVPEIINALSNQNKVNPAGQVGSEPVPTNQEFTYSVRTQGRLVQPEEFANIVVRANPDGSMVRMKDVARIELGAQTYNLKGKLNGAPSAVIAVYQLPDSNAVEAAKGARALMEEIKQRFPQDLDYVVALDTTAAVTAGVKEIAITMAIALVLVLLVVFVFLQNWRATLIPACAIPVSLIGTFAFFPVLGFSINTLSLFGLVLAIGLVVDDAIVVVEATEAQIEKGLKPKDAAFQAMKEVMGPVVATTLILVAVFVPTIFIPGITGRLYQQFALTISVSVLISSFNALSLSPALAGLVLKPKSETKPMKQVFFGWFNRALFNSTNKYVQLCATLIRKVGFSFLMIALVAVLAGWFGKSLPTSFLPDEDQGYVFVDVKLPKAASLQRTEEVCKKIESILKDVPGVEYYTTVVGFSLLSQVQSTYSAFFFVTFKPWDERKSRDEKYQAIKNRINQEVAQIPDATIFAFSPPAIPGVGNSGGFTFILEDRSGSEMEFLAKNTQKFLEAARKRPELAQVNSSLLVDVPQVYVDVNRDKVLKQGVDLDEVYETLQTFMGGYFVNYFNRFGRQWQVYVQAEGEYRTQAKNVGQFYVENNKGEMVPLSALVTIKNVTGPEFIMHYNLYRCAQINGNAAPGYSSAQAMKALEEVFAETMPKEMGFDYSGMSFQEQKAAEGVPTWAVFALSLVFVFLILTALYESWSLPFSVLLGTPIAVFGAFLALWLRAFPLNVYGQIGLVMLIGLAAKNAVLIVEFAKNEHDKNGKSYADAALEGAKIRLRPILMTALTFIFGCVPLAIASGAGAIGRQTLGTAVIGGLTAATCLAIFLVPVTYYAIEKFSERKTVKKLETEEDLTNIES